MKLLLAESDRDLLMTYKKLFEIDSHEVTAVFDGTQVIAASSGKNFDLVILDRDIPRVSSGKLIKMFTQDNIPVIELLHRMVTPSILLEENAASSYINFPFFPFELKERAAQVAERAKSGKPLQVGGFEIDTSKFRASDGTRFTNEEINILTSLKNNAQFDVRHVSSYINAINNKLSRANRGYRVKYVIKEGYRLVKNNE